jgi:ABC-type spermidine/putrescine transport system permease subunit II
MHERGVIGTAFCTLGALALAFLLVPILMIFPLSIEPGSFLRFPPSGFGLKWYEAYLTSGSWIDSTILSLQIALCASMLATVLGTAAAIGIERNRVPGRRILGALLLSPMLLPNIVTAVAIYRLYSALGLVGTRLGIVLAHTVLGLPFVMLNVGSALRGVPHALDEAAMTLGAHPVTALLLVVLPLVWRGVVAGAVFAFVISFDEVVIAMFLSSPATTTLPKRMLDGIFFDLTPMLAAISALIILFNVSLACVGLSFARARPVGAV